MVFALTLRRGDDAITPEHISRLRDDLDDAIDADVLEPSPIVGGFPARFYAGDHAPARRDAASGQFARARAQRMIAELPPLSDREKHELSRQLEAWGLLRRDAYGRRWLTERGHHVGIALTAHALHEQATSELDEATPPPPH